jgi:hypothetical protein
MSEADALKLAKFYLEKLPKNQLPQECLNEIDLKPDDIVDFFASLNPEEQKSLMQTFECEFNSKEHRGQEKPAFSKKEKVNYNNYGGNSNYSNNANYGNGNASYSNNSNYNSNNSSNNSNYSNNANYNSINSSKNNDDFKVQTYKRKKNNQQKPRIRNVITRYNQDNNFALAGLDLCGFETYKELGTYVYKSKIKNINDSKLYKTYGKDVYHVHFPVLAHRKHNLIIGVIYELKGGYLITFHNKNGPKYYQLNSLVVEQLDHFHDIFSGHHDYIDFIKDLIYNAMDYVEEHMQVTIKKNPDYVDCEPVNEETETPVECKSEETETPEEIAEQIECKSEETESIESTETTE